MMTRLLIAALIAATPLAAQPDTLWVRNNFAKREARIPMRDGVHLFTTIYVPKDTTQRYPILLRRTPYSAGPYGDTNYVQLGGLLLAIAEQGYIIAFQDVRGRFMSEGEFVDVRPQVTTAQGAVHPFGAATQYGGAAGQGRAIAAIAAHRTNGGYWLLASA